MNDQNPYQPGERRESATGFVWQFPAAFVCLTVALLLAGRTVFLLSEIRHATANSTNAATPAGVAGGIAGGIAEGMKYAVFCAPLLAAGLVCLWIGFRRRARRFELAREEPHFGS